MLLALLLLASLPSLPLSAEEPATHWLHAGAMPPGAIGAQRLLRGGPLYGYSQPVELRAPSGISLSNGGEPMVASERLLVGLEVGGVYRFRAEGVPGFPGVAVYPSVELIDRLYPPPGKEQQFPVPIDLTLEDLRLAAEGAFVTRVVYVEDPRTALPIEQNDEQQWFEARAGDDPLVLAGELGRPIAIVRIGSRIAPPPGPDCRFGSPIRLATHAPSE